MLFVCQSVCVQDYCKCNRPILFKLDAIIGPTSWKNWLTFGGDLFQDTNSGSLFHFHHCCRMGNFRRFISISHSVSSRFSRHSAKWLMPTIQWIHSILRVIQIRIDPEIQIQIPDQFSLRLGALVAVCALWAQSSLNLQIILARDVSKFVNTCRISNLDIFCVVLVGFLYTCTGQL